RRRPSVARRALRALHRPLQGQRGDRARLSAPGLLLSQGGLHHRPRRGRHAAGDRRAHAFRGLGELEEDHRYALGVRGRNRGRVLIADDNPANVRILSMRLAADGYEVVTARDGEEALTVAGEAQPDLILLDVMMPKVDGITVCRRLKQAQTASFTPIILVTAMTEAKDIVAGLEAGGEEDRTHAVDHAALSAPVRAILGIRGLHDPVSTQADEIARGNATLERRVAEQVDQLEQMGRLKRFFPPPLADAILAGGAADPLRPHRREISVVFLDLRGFTAFAE